MNGKAYVRKRKHKDISGIRSTFCTGSTGYIKFVSHTKSIKLTPPIPYTRPTRPTTSAKPKGLPDRGRIFGLPVTTKLTQHRLGPK